MICISVFICFCLSLARLPGTEIAGVGANWFLIWVVSWSLRRSPLDAAIGGVTIGLIMDGLTGEPGVFPTHILGFTIVAVLAALLQKER
ncbi:MAG: rod shape-determining protein MreD, partial [Prochlorotrichaceae cyanobacterium]